MNKYVEIRDNLTMMPVMIINLDSNPATRYTGHHGGPYLLLMKLSTYETQNDPHRWNNMTMKTAHQHLLKLDWDDIKNGDVIDVEYISGKTEIPKIANLEGWDN